MRSTSAAGSPGKGSLKRGRKERVRTRGTAALLIGIAVLLTAYAAACCGEARRRQAAAALPLGNRIANADEIVSSLRKGIKGRARSVSVSFSYGSDIFDELNGVVDDWMRAALEETGKPDEGDYLRYQYGGYTFSSTHAEEDGASGTGLPSFPCTTVPLRRKRRRRPGCGSF